MIRYDEKTQVFRLDTPHTSYAIGIVEGYAAHLYYGPRLCGTALTYLARPELWPLFPEEDPAEKVSFLDRLPMEYSFGGTGDFREACLQVKNGAGQCGCELTMTGYAISAGKEALPGLPASFPGEAEAQTLRIFLRDKVLGLRVTLFYSVFADSDVIARHARIENDGREPVILTRALSACLDFDAVGGEELLTLSGAWAREHIIERRRIGRGSAAAESLRGEGGHDANPFMAVLSAGAGQENGSVTALSLVYSGSFLAKVQKSGFDQLRMAAGIHPEGFGWMLAPGETFVTPEALLVYSEQGLTRMTHAFHDFFRAHLLPPRFVYAGRPVLINSWEATYFAFEEEKLLEIAAQAKQSGLELLVVDDGWFGEGRNAPSGSLGDWKADRKKFPKGFSAFSEQVHGMGLMLGLWFEPEMISRESQLFEAHPDWMLAIFDRRPSRCRNQYLLDLSNPAVLDYLTESIGAMIREAKLDYLKWDMNRSICDLGSAALPIGRQGEILHRHVLGLYEIQRRITAAFPELLLENCSSGGARFDAGMLYYSPQIWCSDDMDPLERAAIQEGTELVYPLSCMGAHVCKATNDITGRKVPFGTRAQMAMAGTFGYELDITACTEEELAAIPGQLALYRRLENTLRRGDYYRIASLAEGSRADIMEIAEKDGSRAFVFYMQPLAQANDISRMVRLRGLAPEAEYRVIVWDGGEEEKPVRPDRPSWEEAEIPGRSVPETWQGDVLMHAGYPFPARKGDFISRILELIRVKEQEYGHSEAKTRL